MPEIHPLVADLRRRRIDAGLSQKDVGEGLGYARATVNRWEVGFHAMTAGELVAYAALLGLDVQLAPVTDEAGGDS